MKLYYVQCHLAYKSWRLARFIYNQNLSSAFKLSHNLAKTPLYDCPKGFWDDAPRDEQVPPNPSRIPPAAARRGTSSKTKLEISCYCKNVLATNYFIRINPYNVLSYMQKTNFKKLHSWLLQDAHGLPHQLLAKAQLHEVHTHHCREQFFKFRMVLKWVF